MKSFICVLGVSDISDFQIFFRFIFVRLGDESKFCNIMYCKKREIDMLLLCGYRSCVNTYGDNYLPDRDVSDSESACVIGLRLETLLETENKYILMGITDTLVHTITVLRINMA